MKSTNTYSNISEGDRMIKDLCNTHPETFWAVIPEKITVMGIDNNERSEKSITKNPIWSRLKNVKGSERQILQDLKSPIRYIIEVYCSDWNRWNDKLRLCVLANHLLAITPDSEKKNMPDCVGFNILFDAVGIDWEVGEGENIPHLLNDDVKFDLSRRPGIEIEKEEGEGAEESEDAGEEEDS
jgi:hypothetical protein